MISARMSEALRKAVEKTVPGEAWEAFGEERATEIRECAEVRDTQPLRYIAIRIRPRQENLFAGGGKGKHFAVVSNIGEWKAAWRRMAVIAYNVMTAWPKRLRFLIFNTAGRLVHHARQIVLRLAEWLEAMRLLSIRV